MVQKNEVQKEKLKRVLKRIKVVYGKVPPQMEFLGNIEVEYLEEFLKMVVRMVKHPNIQPDLFGFIRLHIAFKEDYTYCKKHNTHFLLAKGYEQKVLDRAIETIESVPFDSNHQALATFAVKAIYRSRECKADDFERLYAMGWGQKDVFDAIDHAGTIFRNGRILTAYRKKF